MKQNLVLKPASQDEIDLYCFMGEALCMIQTVEGALSVAITIKLHSDATKEAADEVLNKHRSYTLGRAIKLAGKENLFPSELQNELNDFLLQRNWLVHKEMVETKNDLYIELAKGKLFQRIKLISKTAHALQHKIELDLINFCTSKGRDMSKILALINERYRDLE